MSNDTLTNLVQRLESTERELAATQLQVRALQALATPRSHSRRNAVPLLLGLVLMFTVSRALDTKAQGAGAKSLTVAAPFRVVNASGKVSLLVEGDGTVTIGDKAAGAVTIGVGKSGAGFVGVRNPAGKITASIGQYEGGIMGVRVFGGTEVAQAEMTADSAGGAFTVYSTSGQPAGLLRAMGSDGSGHLELDRSGKIYVEAGVMTRGVGVVRAGPGSGSPSPGGIPYEIVGRP